MAATKVVGIKKRRELPKIMSFSWNADGTKICESLSRSHLGKNRPKWQRSIRIDRGTCEKPKFWLEVSKDILEETPDIVFVTTTGEDSTSSFFHEEFLPFQMSSLEFNHDGEEITWLQFSYEKLSNVGDVPSGLKVDLTPQPNGTALRSSVYVTSDLFDHYKKFTEKHIGSRKAIATSTFTFHAKKAGAIAHYIRYGPLNWQTLALISIDLASSFHMVSKFKSYIAYRELTRAANLLALDKFLRRLVYSENKINGSKIDDVVISGDFDYDVLFEPDEAKSQLEARDRFGLKYFLDRDEFINVMKEGKESVLGDFMEGKGGKGPEFFPNWRLKYGRPVSCHKEDKFSIECLAKKSPIGDKETESGWPSIGWHDRMIYTKEAIDCLDYYKVDHLSMNRSTHAGIVGTFKIKRNVLGKAYPIVRGRRVEMGDGEDSSGDFDE